jgi:hypothetical protein
MPRPTATISVRQALTHVYIIDLAGRTRGVDRGRAAKPVPTGEQR